jgi:aspartate-semialdehyde dehydrogenase
MSHRVGVIGATGAVGQRLVQLLDPHPEFEVAALTASPDSAGDPYREAADWLLPGDVPAGVADVEVGRTEPSAVPDDVDLLFSSLPSGVAAEVEPAFLEAGYVVSSNSSNDRLADDVPLVIPEVNPDHLGLLEVQRAERGWDGALVKNPNCSTITFLPPLAALDEFGVEKVHVATLQAVSGAGYSGVTSMEILDNVVPHIGGEEEKMETESRKLLGEFTGDAVAAHDVEVAASCNRVATVDGHLENVWVETAESVGPDAAAATMEGYEGLALPNAPDQLIEVMDQPDRPQPRLDRDRADGMNVVVGGLQASPFGLQFDCLAHNTLRGAAGASLLNGELLAAEGHLD